MTTELADHDQILVPVDETLYPARGIVPAGYQPYPLLHLTRKLWRSSSDFGLSPLHFIDQRGPYQDGSTPLDMRLDPRTVQVVIEEACCTRTDYWDKRAEILDLLRPNRSFDGTVRPLIYRKWLPAGKLERGTDGEAVTGTAIVHSNAGRFVDRGLDAGAPFTFDGSPYTVGSVPNDYTVILTANHGKIGTGLDWEYRRGWAKRDLYCLLEAGPTFDEGPGAPPAYPEGYREALRFVAHDPCWYSAETLEQTWDATLTSTGDLVFNGTRGWLGVAAGAGYWLFDFSTLLADATAIVYWGTVRAKPTVTVTGPATSVYVENATTGVNVTLDVGLDPGEIATIDTLDLTVTSDTAGNLLPYMSGDLATLGIEPSPQAPDRINVFNLELQGGTAASETSVTWKNRYIGI